MNDEAKQLSESTVIKVLRLFAQVDHREDLEWHSNLRMFVNCSDAFYWGCSDCEEITEENFPELERALADAKRHGPLLFCARVRKERPQGAMYKYIEGDEIALFDACGPERSAGLGNPYTREQGIAEGDARRKELAERVAAIKAEAEERKALKNG